MPDTTAPAGADPAEAEFATNPASTEPAPAVAYAADAPEEPTAAQAASEPVGRRAARKAAEREAAGLDEEKPATKGQAVLGVMRDVLIAAAIAGCVLFFFKPILVQQRSMEPTFSNGDYIIVSRQAYTLLGDPQHGDVVIFRSRLKDEHNRDKNLIKRLIALPGDTIEIRDGYVYLNGEQQEELYTKDPGETWASGPDGGMPPLTIPEGKVFAMGDNRLNSQDSRDATVGLVDIDDIVGKVVLRLFPFNQIKTF